MFIISAVNRYLFGPMFPVFLCLAGVYLSVRLHFFPLRHPRRTIHALCATGGSFSSLTLALAGTLGVGNIVGVAAAIRLGGAGALFWMWISAFATMLIKYAEIFLSIRYREKDENGYHGGGMYYIRAAFRNLAAGRFFGGLFALLCLLASLFLGNMIQIRAVSDAAQRVMHISPTTVSLVVLGAAFFLIFGNRARISRFTTVVIPVLCVGYILFSCYVLICNASAIPGIFREIFITAFRPGAAVGGIGAGAFLMTLRQGIAKGVFSHEGGCGTAPISYAGQADADPAKTGVWGIIEVFVDTVLLCTLSGLVILTGEAIPNGGSMDVVMAAFQPVLGQAGEWFMFVAIAAFAFSTLICWSFYGGACIRYFSASPKLLRIYRILFCLMVPLGVWVSEKAVWEWTDFCTMAMTLLNTACVLRLLPVVRTGTANYFERRR